MVKLNTLLVFLFLSASVANGQSTLTLDSCINQAYRNFEFNKQVEFTNQITEANIAGIKKNYLPTLDLNAAVTYQNEQITIPIDVPIPGFEAPTAPLNLNNALLSLRQWIYAGGMTKNHRLIQEASGNVSLQEINVQKLDVKNNVMQLYFSVLLQEKQLEILMDKQTVLQERYTEVQSAVQSNMLLESDAQLLKAEILQLQQKITEIEFGRKASVSGLSQLLGLEILEATEFQEPIVNITTVSDFDMRPDVQLMNSQMDVLEAQKGLIQSNYLPKIGVFADAGLGLPGYDIFKDELAPMAKVGITMQWHIFDWNKGSLQKQNLSLSQNLLRLQQDRIKKQMGVKSKTEQQQIQKAKELMLKDDELLTLYSSIASAYASQLENGTITSADYVRQLNKEQEAKTNLELHKLQLTIAILNYNTLMQGQ